MKSVSSPRPETRPDSNMESINSTKYSEESDMEKAKDLNANGSLKVTSEPIQAEAETSMGKARRLPSEKANTIQVEEISSSVETEKPLDEDGFPVGLENMGPADVHIAEEEYPDFKKDGQFDALLVYHENDKVKAHRFLDKLQSENHLSGRGIRITTLEQSVGGQNEIERLEYCCQKSTFFMLLLTSSFCDRDNWMQFYQNKIVMETVANPEKKWCAIPVHTESNWRKPVSYKVPFALQGIRGICMADGDENWAEGAIKLIQQKEQVLIEREREQDREFKMWLMKEPKRRLTKWKREKEKLQREKDKIRQATEESEKMDYDTQPTLNPYAPGFHTQRNVGATGEQLRPPGVPRQAWTSDSNRSTPQYQFTGLFPQAATTTTPHPSSGVWPGIPGMKMTPEEMTQWQGFQSFLAMQQAVNPIFNISGGVINFGNNSQTIIQTSMEDDTDDEEDFQIPVT